MDHRLDDAVVSLLERIDRLVLLAIHLIKSILFYLQNISRSRLGQQVVLYIRKNLFAKMMTLPQSVFEKAQTGDLTS